MENETICSCPFCQTGNYNSADFFLDMSFLKKERPVGVSGLLRVKNDADFLSDCIDSCIDALDELIICYQDCTDNAPEIIIKKQQQFPDKIKVYYYAPPVFCHGLTEEEKKYAFSLPDTSVHKLCNYYNYTLSKATYRYAMKIDSDQVYFPVKLKRYCDAYRRQEKVNISLSDQFILFYARLYRYIVDKYTFLYPLDIFSYIPVIRNLFIKKYDTSVIKNIINNKYVVSLSGINLGYKRSEWGIYILNKYPFNGACDHLIFQIKEDTFYVTVSSGQSPIEIMHYNGNVLLGGWFWFHLQGMRKCSANHSEWLGLTSKLIPTGNFARWENICKRLWLFFLTYEKELPEPLQLLPETTFNLENNKL